MDGDLSDLLPRLRAESDLGWAFASKDFPSHTRAAPEAESCALVSEIIRSKRLRAAISLVSRDEARSEEAVEKDAKQILEEMCHAFSLSSIRGVGFLIHKAFQRVFDGIWVNLDMVKELKRLSQETQLIFLPSHRSYMDFLLLTYVCYTLELSPPVIAAGMDFHGMRFVGEALRRCGAFFIRRSFGEDRVYWAVFCEYVDRLVRQPDHPIEFFIEGTRSRSGKSLTPKTGLLGAVLEPFFKRTAFDLGLVPISVSYSRLLEERLYAYELLGFPKPAESTSGLLRARSALATSLGPVVLRFSQPISARDHFGHAIHREISNHEGRGFRPRLLLGIPHNLGGPDVWEVTAEERTETKRLAHRIVADHQRNRVATIWSLACLILSHDPSPSRSWPDILASLVQLREACSLIGHPFPLRHSDTLEEELSYFLTLHSNLIRLDGDTLQLLPMEAAPPLLSRGALTSALISASLGSLALSAYAAGHLWRLRDAAFLLLPLLGFGRGRLSTERLAEEFTFLRGRLFAREFVASPDEEEGEREATMRRLEEAGVVQVRGGEAWLANAETAELLSRHFQPFLLAYGAFFGLLAMKGEFTSDVELLSRAQGRIVEVVGSGLVPSWLHLLSMDVLRNALGTAVGLGALRRLDDGGLSAEPIAAFVLLDRVRRLTAPSLLPALRTPHVTIPKAKI